MGRSHSRQARAALLPFLRCVEPSALRPGASRFGPGPERRRRAAPPHGLRDRSNTGGHNEAGGLQVAQKTEARHPVKWFRSIVVNGIVIGLPLLIVAYFAVRILLRLKNLLAPVAALFPERTVLGVSATTILAVAGLILVLFAVGLFISTALGSRLVQWLTETILSKMPGYAMLQAMSRSMLMHEDQYATIAVDLHGTGAEVFGLMIDQTDDDRTVVFVPSSPNTASGQVYLVPASRVRRAKMGTQDLLDRLSQHGAKLGREAPVQGPPPLPTGYAAGATTPGSLGRDIGDTTH